MMTPRSALPAALLLMLASPAIPLPPQGATAEERGSNWVRSTYQFGAPGTSPGQLLEPRAVAVGRDNRVYVADTGNHRIQVFTLEGSLVAGWGGRGPEPGKFVLPSAVAVGPDDAVYVADTGNDRIQVFDGQGKFLRSWGGPAAAEGAFSTPRGLAVTKDRVAVVEGDQPRVQVFTPAGEFVHAFGGFGDGPGRFREPAGIAADEDGNLYVADAGAHQIQKFDPAGKPVAQWGTWGSPPALLSGPVGLAYFGGKLYVADSANHRIQVFDRAGTFLFQWGRHPAFAHEGSGRLHFPTGIAVSPSGGFTVVCEPLEHRVQAFSNGNARVVRPMNDLPWWDSLHARFHVNPRPAPPQGGKPTSLVAVLEPDAPAVLFFDVEPRLPVFVARAAGYGRKLGEFGSPAGAALDAAAGRLFVSERANRRIQRLEVTRDPKTSTGFAPGVRVVAAWDLAAVLPGSGLSPERCQPGAVALDPAGGLWLVDEGNSAVLVFDREMKFVRTIRPVTRGTGPTRLVDLAFAPDGTRLYLVDRHAGSILVCDPEGKMLSSWGGELLLPAGIAVDPQGNVYVSDAGTHQILKYDARGKFLLKWGGFGRDPGQFYTPRAIVAAGRNRILVDDVGNHRGQIFDPDGKLVELFHKGGVPAQTGTPSQPMPPK